MAPAVIGIATVAIMLLMALSANKRFAELPELPLHFDIHGNASRSTPRYIALGFMPALAIFVFTPFSLFAPDTVGAFIAGGGLIGAQLLYHWLIGRSQ